MAGKRSSDEIKRDRAEIAQLYLKGWYQVDIAQRINDDPDRPYTLTQQQISSDIKAIRKQWRESSIRDFDEARSQELAKIDNLELEYWRAWESSKETFTSKTTKSEIDPGNNQVDIETSTREEDRIGDPRFLNGVQWCIERRCKLLGLDSPVEMGGTVTVKVIKGVSIDDL